MIISVLVAIMAHDLGEPMGICNLKRKLETL
jgi:hypothetical protein